MPKAGIPGSGALGLWFASEGTSGAVNNMVHGLPGSGSGMVRSPGARFDGQIKTPFAVVFCMAKTVGISPETNFFFMVLPSLVLNPEP